MLKVDAIKLDSKSVDFKKKVIEFGVRHVGESVTFESFEIWLNDDGLQLISTDLYWKAVFTSILRNNFKLEKTYIKDCNHQIITVFMIEK